MKISGIPLVWILLLGLLIAPIGSLSAFATVGSSTIITSSSQNPSTFGHTVTFTASVTPHTATGIVQFNDTNTNPPTTLGTSTLNNTGIATFSTPSLSIGSHNIVAKYLGDANNTASTSGVLAQVVNPVHLSSAITLNANTTSIIFGHTVNFTATVSPNTATGTVQFNDTNTTPPTILGIGTISSGHASFSTSSLSIGSHNIITKYLGNTNYIPSTSNVLTETVNPASLSSTTTLISNTTSIMLNQSVNFTATVSPNTAAGTVQFLINGTNFGSPITLSSGKASTITSSLPIGTNIIIASYSGSSNLSPSSSNSVTVIVTSTVQGGTQGKITGGGHIGKDVNFGFEVNADSPGKKKIKGNIQYNDKNSKIKLHSNNVTSLFIDPGLIQASFSGNAQVNDKSGFAFSVNVTDPDKTGEHDVLSITVTDGTGKVVYKNSGQVKGHIEIHAVHNDNTQHVKPVHEKNSHAEKDKEKGKHNSQVNNNSQGKDKHKSKKHQDD